MYIKLLFLFLVLYLSVNNVKTNENNVDDQEDFLDIGVRLTGDHRDNLIADLIAEEKDIINAGHVSSNENVGEECWRIFSMIDQWNWFTSFSYSTKTWSTIETSTGSNRRRSST